MNVIMQNVILHDVVAPFIGIDVFCLRARERRSFDSVEVMEG
jgi:hypothetical protein